MMTGTQLDARVVDRRLATDVYEPSDADREADDLLKAIVLQALRRTGYPLRGVGVHVSSGRMTLAGRLPSFHLKQVAQTAALSVPSVRSISNMVVVDGRRGRTVGATDTTIWEEAVVADRMGTDYGQGGGRAGSVSQLTNQTVQAADRSSVLVVDDDEELRYFLSIGLSRAGFRVYTASGEEQALAIVALPDLRLDVVLLDLCMPLVDRQQVLQELRALRPRLPACFMSGTLDAEAESSLRRLDVSGVIAKPFLLPEMIEMLTTAIGGAPSVE